MGLFSWKCKGCDHSIKSPYDIPEGWEYMNEAVFLQEHEPPIVGDYDGYGRVGGYDIKMVTDHPEMWHKKCWENAGEPEYTGHSKHAEDQGFFYDNPSSKEMREALELSEGG